MKNLYFIALLVFTSLQVSAQYCIPEFASGCNNGDLIDSFTIPSAGFSDLDTGCSPGSYSDLYATKTITLSASVIYPFNVTHGFASQIIRIWADFNNDNVFDETSELIGSGASGTFQATNGGIQVPITAQPGTYRLRIADRYSSAPIPCNIQGYGEAHDYKLIVTAAPSCITPSVFTATAVTAVSATFTWVAPPNAPALGYELYYSTSATPPVAATVPTNTGVTGTGTVLNGLTPATQYYVYVRSNCSSTDKSGWSFVQSILTECAIVPSFSQNFDTVVNADLPSCWEQIGTTGYVYVQTYSPIAGPNSLYIAGDTFSGMAVVKLPSVNTLQLGTYRLKFKLRGAYSPGGKLEVGYLTDLTDPSTFFALDSYTAGSGTVAENYVINNITAPAGVENLVIRQVETPGISVVIDDVVYELIPSCAEPGVVTVSNATLTTADVSWLTPPSVPANGYQVYYSTTNTPPTATTVPSMTGLMNLYTTLTGLTSGSMYYVWVRSNCSATDQSPWSNSGTFITLCTATNAPYSQNFSSVTLPDLPICSSVINNGTGNAWKTSTAVGYSGNVLNYSWNGTNPADTWYFNTGINMTAGITYNIGYKYGNDGTFYAEKLKVAIGMAENAAAMTTVLADYPNIQTGTPTVVATTFTPTVSGVYYLGFQAYSDANQNQLYVDDISVVNSALATSEINLKDAGIMIYPNPFTDFISISAIKDVVSVSVVDMAGRIIKTVKAQREINLSELKSGMYLINLTLKDGSVKTVKAIKK